MRSIIQAATCMLLAACDAAPPPSTQGTAPNPISNPQPSRSPSTAPPRTQRTSSADTAITPSSAAPLTSAGWGPLTVGMTLPQITAALGSDAEPDLVGGAEPDSCDQFRPARAPRDIMVMTERNRLSRVSLIRPGLLVTDRGFGVGASASAVSTAYGSAAISTPHKYQPAPAAYITVWSAGAPAGDAPAGPAARGIVYEIDTKGRVAAIHAGGPAIQYVEGCA